MPLLTLHPVTESSLTDFIDRPAHALLLTGHSGSGKASIARYTASAILQTAPDDLPRHPYVTWIAPVENKAIPIDDIRELQHILTLKIPGKRAGIDVARIAIIEEAHLLTIEAQNALLKTLEEPPLDMVLILTATSADSLLPTIRSRVRELAVTAPKLDDLRGNFLAQGFAAAAIEKAFALSGGMPGLSHALLTDPENHPLFEATQIARQLLGASAYERLALVDGLSKQKMLCDNICFILGQMSRATLLRLEDDSSPAAKRWQNIMKAAFTAQSQFRQNTQSKLVLMNLMLDL